MTAIVTANLLVALGPGVMVVNAFLWIGLDLTARDRLHEIWNGRGLVWKMGLLVLCGSALTWLLNGSAGRVALASLAAFAGAGLVDSLTYQVLRRRAWLLRANGSNLLAALVDSLIFPALVVPGGLGLGFSGLQLGAKVAGGLFWSFVLKGRS